MTDTDIHSQGQSSILKARALAWLDRGADYPFQACTYREEASLNSDYGFVRIRM
eukprot:gene28508-31665_t